MDLHGLNHRIDDPMADPGGKRGQYAGDQRRHDQVAEQAVEQGAGSRPDKADRPSALDWAINFEGSV